MATSTTGDIYQVTIKGVIHGQTTLTQFHYLLAAIGGAPPTTTTDVYVAGVAQFNVVGSLVPRFVACTPSNWTATEFWIQRIRPIRIRKFSSAYNPVIAGLRPPTVLTNIQSSITRVTESANRTGIGGIRVPLSEGDVVGGVLLEVVKTALATLGQEMLATQDITAATGHVLEPILFGIISPVDWRQNPLFTTIVQTQARTIRRRTVGLGI